MVGIIEAFCLFVTVTLVVLFILVPIVCVVWSIGAMLADEWKLFWICLTIAIICGTTDVYFIGNNIDPIQKVSGWFHSDL